MSSRPLTPLKAILIDEGRKQSWLAKRTGIAPSTINQIVHGLPPSDSQAAAIAAVLGRHVDELWPPVKAEAA